MENNLQVFENVEFGKIRTVQIKKQIFFIAVDVCKALDLSNPSKTVSRLDDDERANFKLGRQGNTNIVNEYGLYNLIMSSRKPTAKAFKRWVTHEVIPSIRKTGSYATQPVEPTDDLKEKRLVVMHRNAKVREANIWLKLAQGGNENFKQICRTYAANLLAEKEIVSLPEVARKTYTATEIGKILGITANKVGRLTTAHNLKTAEYGGWYHDKSRYSNKEIETFRYHENVIDKLKEILKNNEKGAKATDDDIIYAQENLPEGIDSIIIEKIDEEDA